MISRGIILSFLFLAANPATGAEFVFPSGDASWSVTFEKGDSEPAGQSGQTAEKRKVEIARKGALRHDTITWSDGTTTECWWIETPPLALFDNKQDGVVVTTKAGYMGNRRLDASSFNWVSRATFVDQRTFKQKKCDYYQMESDRSHSEPMILRAWIDAETRYPLGLQTGVHPAIFEFHAKAPTGALVMPARFEHALKQAMAALAPPKRLDKR